MISINKNKFESLESRHRATLINSLIGVKSANLIGTQSLEGNSNLAIFNSLFHLGASPAMFGFVIRPDTEIRDTLHNLREHPYLTVNHVHTQIIEKAHQTSARYPSHLSEFDTCHLKKEFLAEHPAPFVAESKVKFSAKFLREIAIPENKTQIMICEITSIYLADNFLNSDYFLDITKADTVGVSGLDQYLSLAPLGRASYAKPDKGIVWKR